MAAPASLEAEVLAEPNPAKRFLKVLTRRASLALALVMVDANVIQLAIGKGS